MPAEKTIDELLAELPILNPDDYPDRDSLIRDLAGRFGWPAARVGGMFKLSAKQVRRIAGPAIGSADTLPGEAPGLVRREAPKLSIEEARAMINDYLRCPYTRPGERRAARAWIDAQIAESAVA